MPRFKKFIRKLRLQREKHPRFHTSARFEKDKHAKTRKRKRRMQKENRKNNR